MISLESRNNEVSMVSSDGEPHEILTLAAITSGIVGATILLVIVGTLIKYKKQSSNYQNNTKRLKLFPCRQNYKIPVLAHQMTISTITGDVIRLQSELSSTVASSSASISTSRDFIIPINLHDKEQSMQNVSGVVSVAC